MGLLDGWPFKSKAEIERERREFGDRVFPMGEAQREAALAVLKQVTGKRMRDPERLFAFITAKDRYVKDEKTAEALDKARAQLKKMNWIKAEDIDVVLALVRLDAAIDSLSEYPTAEDVMRACESA